MHGFSPYFYAKAPEGFSDADILPFTQALNNAVKERSGSNYLKAPLYIHRVTIEQKQTIMHYQEKATVPFLKITTVLPNMVPTARNVLLNGLNWSGHGTDVFTTTYESNILYTLRFMVDNDIAGGQWLQLKAPNFTLRSDRLRTTRCQYEIDVNYQHVVPKSPLDGDWGRLAPMRILSFDIECFAEKGFPEVRRVVIILCLVVHFVLVVHSHLVLVKLEMTAGMIGADDQSMTVYYFLCCCEQAQRDPVIQIASILTVQGESQPMMQSVLTLGSCSDIVGVDVVSFSDEKKMLATWQQLVNESDADVVTGYNINNFDIPYLLDRARKLKLEGFAELGCVDSSNCAFGFVLSW